MYVEIRRIKSCEEWPTVYVGHNKYAYEQSVRATSGMRPKSLISVSS